MEQSEQVFPFLGVLPRRDDLIILMSPHLKVEVNPFWILLFLVFKPESIIDAA